MPWRFPRPGSPGQSTYQILHSSTSDIPTGPRVGRYGSAGGRVEPLEADFVDDQERAVEIAFGPQDVHHVVEDEV